MVPNRSVWHLYDLMTVAVEFRFCFIYTAEVRKNFYDTYSECCEPYTFCHVNILLQNTIQDFCVFLSLYIIYELIKHDYGTQ